MTTPTHEAPARSTFTRIGSALVFLRLVDSRHGALSLTSLALAGAGVVACVSQTWPAVCAFLIAGGLYAHKRFLNYRRTQADERVGELTETVASLSQTVTALEKLPAQLIQLDNRTAHLRGR